ncbi:MAG TPA: hypothetical protein VM223_20135 [Planctomycetota bacterium]|nr:hypothetical protein [Planctomycetota bacterium]
MSDDQTKITIERDYLEKLQSELETLRAGSERDRRRAELLEERIKRETVDAARRRILADALGRRSVPLDISRAAVILERLTADVSAQIDDDGNVIIPDAEQQKIREQVAGLIDSVAAAPSAPPTPPPIKPGEPPTRLGRGASGGSFTNSWDTSARKTGTARGRELLAQAARELEKEGRL